MHYSIISRMEAVYVRDARLKYDSTLSCMENLEDGMSWCIVVSFTNSSFEWLMLPLRDKWSSRFFVLTAARKSMLERLLEMAARTQIPKIKEKMMVSTVLGPEG